MNRLYCAVFFIILLLRQYVFEQIYLYTDKENFVKSTNIRAGMFN